MKSAPMKHIADQLATHGRYGDTMLVHMNPHEVAGIASLAPGGKLTINPVTGQPEAFLPFLAPLLGGWLGSAAAGAGMLGGLGTVAGSAIGSGLATTLATGDLEQGLISGITGFGLGSALSGLGGAAGAAGDAAQQLATTAVPDIASQAGQAAAGGVGGAAGAVPTGIQALPGAAGNVAGVPVDFSKVAGASQFTGANPMSQMGLDVDSLVRSGARPGQFANLAETATAPPNTFTNNLMAPFRQPGEFMKNLSKPENFLPMYVGEGTNASIRAQKLNEQAGRDFEKQQEEEGSIARQGILRALERVRSDYGMFAGGQVDYAEGGEVDSSSNFIKNILSKGKTDTTDYSAYVNELYGKYGSPSGIQSSLRGTVVNTPPAFDYSALFSGGSGYAPGIAPEFMFFGNAAPSTGGGTSPGTGLPGGTPGTGVPGGTPGTGGTGGGTSPISVPQNPYMPTRTPGMGGYFRGPATSETDIGSILDRLSDGGEDWWRNELAKQPPRMFAEGGEVEPTMAGLDMVEGADPVAPANPVRAEYDNLVKMTIAAIQGQVENPEAIIQQFVAEYGNEAFLQLRESVLQNVQPGAQTQGLVDGEGGGMDDLVQGSIADGRPVAVSPGEYIIPADVVSAAGDGHTNSGAKFFDDLIESIRVKKNGTPEQPKPMKDIMG